MKKGTTYIRRLSELQKQTACVRYERGESGLAIARDFGVDQDSIYSLLKRRGVDVRKHGQTGRLNLNEAAFDEINEASAYWAGFLMADGSIHRRTYSTYVSLALAIRDAEHVGLFRDFLQSGHKLEQQPGRGYVGSTGYIRLSIASRRLAAALSRFGVTPDKTKNGKASVLEFDRHFWRGMVDGDGFVFVTSKLSHPVVGLVGNHTLMIQFATFASSITGNHHKVQPMHSIYSFRTSSGPAVRLLKHLYGDCTVALARKKATADMIIATHG